MHLSDQSGGAVRGIVAWRVFRHGAVIEDVRDDNLVVAGARAVNASLVGGAPGFAITRFGIGTSLLAAVPGNTLLTGAYTNALSAVTYPTAGQVQFTFGLGPTEANGMAIGEIGLLTAGGILYARKVRAGALTKTSAVSLAGTWTLVF